MVPGDPDDNGDLQAGGGERSGDQPSESADQHYASRVRDLIIFIPTYIEGGRLTKFFCTAKAIVRFINLLSQNKIALLHVYRTVYCVIVVFSQSFD